MVALVTDVDDPQKLGRVKIKLPTLADDYESDWARVVQPGAGKTAVSVFLPEVGDEVLVAFEHGDIRRPYVLGGLWSVPHKPPLGDGPVRQRARPARRASCPEQPPAGVLRRRRRRAASRS